MAMPILKMAEVFTGRKFAKLKRYSFTLKKYVMPVTPNPDDKDQITNADESKKLPDDTPEPLEGTKTDDLDLEPDQATDAEIDDADDSDDILDDDTTSAPDYGEITDDDEPAPSRSAPPPAPSRAPRKPPKKVAKPSKPAAKAKKASKAASKPAAKKKAAKKPAKAKKPRRTPKSPTSAPKKIGVVRPLADLGGGGSMDPPPAGGGEEEEAEEEGGEGEGDEEGQ